MIGINGRISVEKRGRVNAGAGYAISINQIKYFLDHLLSGRVVDHATLGATVRSDEFSNVIVDTILPSCNAYFQGLREGDEIVSFGGRPIGSVNQFKNVLGIYPKGWKVPLTYRRDGERYDLFVRLEALHSAGELVEFASPPAPPEDEEGEAPHDGPLPHGMPQLPGMHPPKMEIPEQYAHLFEGRLGFANYAFNVKKQEELLKGLKQLGQFPDEPAKWTFEGVINDQAPYRLVVTKVAGMLQVPSEQRVFLLDLGRPETYLAGWNNEGMLIAFYEFQQLLTRGKDAFAEFYYVGSEPLDGDGPRVDILATMEAGRECRWYFNQGQLVGWDTFVIPETPVCEVRLDGWEAGEQRPLGWTINTPGQPPVRFSVSSMQTEAFEVPELPAP